MTKLVDWSLIVPGASAPVDLDFTDAELVPEATITAFTRDDGSVNTRGLGRMVRSRSKGAACIRTVADVDGIEDGIYVLSIKHNPSLAGKKKNKK